MSNQSDANHTFLGEVSFSVSARVAMQLGRESISNSIVAITELVKNAYDADAEIVKIRFSGLESEKTVLVIEDNGNGMTKQQMLENWMVLGTENKRMSSESQQKHRVLTGEKGLGRLGLDRLCAVTTVRTFVDNQQEGTELEIVWEKYEGVNKRLEEIKHSLFRIPKDAQDPITKNVQRISKGTSLILYDLKDSWTRDYLLELKQELTLLVSPFAGINDFTIELDSGMGWPDIDGKIVSAVTLRAAEWSLTAAILENGAITYSITSPQHKKEYELKETPWNERFHGRERLPRCGPLQFKMYWFSREDVKVEDLSFSKSQIASFLEQNQGIRIYRDNFRVKPYGQPNGEGDWLTLSYRRQQSPGGVTQGGWRVGYNQVVGAVFVERARNTSLIDQTNREGIVQGPAFYDMRTFVLDAIRFFELSRGDFEQSHKEQGPYENIRDKAKNAAKASVAAVEDLKDTTEAVKQILEQAQESNTTSTLHGITDLLDSAVSKIDTTMSIARKTQEEFAAIAEEKEKELQQQKDTLGNLASLGILTTCFGHETLGAATAVATNAQQLNYEMVNGLFMVTPDIRTAVTNNLEFIVHESQKIESFARFALRNVSRDNRARQKIYIPQIISYVFNVLGKSLEEKNITVELDLPEDISPILAFRIDWESIFVNLITNSVWALENTPAAQRRIKVSVQETPGILEITFADSGAGFEAGTEDKIFLPTFSTKRNEKGDTIGTGMGLTIVKGFVESYHKGTIKAKSPCSIGGAEFCISVPVPKLSDRGKKN